MAIPSNPIAIFRPNWANGIVERLEWLTSVVATYAGSEQRRRVRLTPRRSFEISYNRSKAERTFFDLWMMNLAAEEVFLPLWHDQGHLTHPASEGDAYIRLDTAYREYLEGGYAVLVKDSFNYEIVEIAEVLGDRLTLAEFLGKSWPKNTKVYPLRLATLDPETQGQALSSRVNDVTLLYTLTGPNEIEDEGDWDDFYKINGAPVLTTEPNRRDAIDIGWGYSVVEQDQQLGLRRRVVMRDSASTTQGYSWWAKGREAQYRVRQLLYRLKGRFQPVYMPTFAEDVTLAAPAPANSYWITIRNIGYHIIKGIAEGLSDDTELSRGRRRLLFRVGSNFADTFIYAATPINGGEDEELELHPSAYPKIALPNGTPGSFVELARMDQDVIELHHHADSDGLMEVAVAFRTLPGDDPAPRVGNWLYKVNMAIETPGASPTGGGLYLYGPYGSWGPLHDGRPNGQHGLYIPGGAFIGGPAGQQNEVNLPVGDPANWSGNPNLRGQKIWDSTGTGYNAVWTFYTPPPSGNWQLTSQFPAGNWGAVGLPDGSPLKVQVKPWYSPGYTVVASGMAVGLWPAYWQWES
jgi:hypothetical protein